MLLFYAYYAPRVRMCLVSLVSLIKSDFGFSSCPDGLEILYGDKVFGHATIKNNFLVLDLDDSYNIILLQFLSHI